MAVSLRSFRVIQNEPIADGCFLLTLEPADGQPMFPFVAGQWVMAHLPAPDQTLDEAIASRSTWRGAFSIASAPSESHERLELAIKVTGDFTARLQRLQPMEIVALHGPFGVFTLRPGTERLVFFASGIGVTPFRSMIREILATHDPRELVLIYSNRTRAETSFEEEVRELAYQFPQFTAHFLVTRETPSEDWEGMSGRLDAEKLQRILPEVASTEFLMCGSVEFMDAIKELLTARGVDVKAKLRKELFS